MDIPENTQREASTVFTLRDVRRPTRLDMGDQGEYRCEVTNRGISDVQTVITNITVLCEQVWAWVGVGVWWDEAGNCSINYMVMLQL